MREDLRKKVLVVDDEPHIRRILSFRLERAGYEVRAAEGGSEALKLLETEEVDFVISDVRMPDGDGVSLLEAIRSRDAARPPVLLISGFADISDSQARAKGALGLFPKPFRMENLLAIVRRVLDEGQTQLV